MELYLFVQGLLAWTVLIAVAFPLNAAMAVLAHRIWRGNKPLDEDDQDEHWTRAFLASGSIAVAAFLTVVIDYVLADWAKIPAGIVHIVVYLCLFSLAAYLMLFFFSLDDYFGAMSLLVIYLYLPMFVLWPINRLTGLFNFFLNYLYAWLVTPT